MRIPRLVDKKISYEQLLLTFDTGEDRYFNVEELLMNLNSTGVSVFELKDLENSIIDDGVIVFPTIKISLPTEDGEEESFYDIDPDYVYKNSLSKEASIGEIFKELRTIKKVSQDEVADRCRTSKSYISKFENNKIQLEWNSIRKLFFLGLEEKVDATSLILGSNISNVSDPNTYIVESQFIEVQGAVLIYGSRKMTSNIPNSTQSWISNYESESFEKINSSKEIEANLV